VSPQTRLQKAKKRKPRYSLRSQHVEQAQRQIAWLTQSRKLASQKKQADIAARATEPRTTAPLIAAPSKVEKKESYRKTRDVTEDLAGFLEQTSFAAESTPRRNGTKPKTWRKWINRKLDHEKLLDALKAEQDEIDQRLEEEGQMAGDGRDALGMKAVDGDKMDCDDL